MFDYLGHDLIGQTLYNINVSKSQTRRISLFRSFLSFYVGRSQGPDFGEASVFKLKQFRFTHTCFIDFLKMYESNQLFFSSELAFFRHEITPQQFSTRISTFWKNGFSDDWGATDPPSIPLPTPVRLIHIFLTCSRA